MGNTMNISFRSLLKKCFHALTKSIPHFYLFLSLSLLTLTVKFFITWKQECIYAGVWPRCTFPCVRDEWNRNPARLAQRRDPCVGDEWSRTPARLAQWRDPAGSAGCHHHVRWMLQEVIGRDCFINFQGPGLCLLL